MGARVSVPRSRTNTAHPIIESEAKLIGDYGVWQETEEEIFEPTTGGALVGGVA